MIIGLIGGGLSGLPEGMRYPTGGQGKDTIADYLEGKGFTRVSFAFNLKRECAEAYGTTVEILDNRELKETAHEQWALENCSNEEFVLCALRALGEEDTPEARAKVRSSRVIQQLWGTDYRRKMYGDDYWLKQGLAQVKGPGNYVVTDVRLFNEGVEGLQAGFCLVRLTRLGTEVPYTGREHPSEIELLNFPTHYDLVNKDNDFAGLYQQVDNILADWPRYVAESGSRKAA